MRKRQYIFWFIAIILIFSFTGCSDDDYADFHSVLIYDINFDGDSPVLSFKTEDGGEMSLKFMNKEKYNLIVDSKEAEEGNIVKQNIDYAQNIKPGSLVDIWVYEDTNEIVRAEMKESYSTTSKKVAGLTDSGKKYGKLSVFTFENLGVTRNLYVSEDMANSLKTSENGNYHIKYDKDYNLFISTE